MAQAPQRADRLAQVEVRSIDHVPAAERHGKVRDQFTLWFALNANIFPVVLGGVLIIMGLDFAWACAAIVAGIVIGLLLVGFHAIQGPRLGVPQMIQSRGQFGFYGAVLVFAASIVLDFGFLAAQLVIQADAMNLLVGSVTVPEWIAILTVPVVILTIYGYDWIHRWQRWMTALLGVTFAVIFVQALVRGTPTGALSGHPPAFALFMGGTGLFVISMVSWAPYVSDYSRYLPENVSRPATFWAVFLGCAIPQAFCAILGAYLTVQLPHADSTVAAVREVAGSWALPVMALSLIGSDVANAYTGMLAVASIVSCFREVRHSVRVRVLGSLLVIAAGTLSALLGYQQFVNNLSNFLNVLLYVFIPWSAINLTDYYLVRHGDYDVASFFTPHGRYGGYQWRGLVAYVVAVGAQVPFIDQAFYTGPLVGPLGNVDISWVVGGVAGVLCYLAALRVPSWSRPSTPSHPTPAAGLPHGPRHVLSGGPSAKRVAQRGARADAELGEGPVQMSPDRPVRHRQPRSDLLVAEAGRGQLRDLQLLRGQRPGPVRFLVVPGRCGGGELSRGAVGPGGRVQALKGRQRYLEVMARPGDLPEPAQPLAVQQVHPGQVERPPVRVRCRERGLEQPGRVLVGSGQRGDGPGEQRLARFQGAHHHGEIAAARHAHAHATACHARTTAAAMGREHHSAVSGHEVNDAVGQRGCHCRQRAYRGTASGLQLTAGSRVSGVPLAAGTGHPLARQNRAVRTAAQVPLSRAGERARDQR
jgi:NCS1 family nucleobase:cation symporter-1